MRVYRFVNVGCGEDPIQNWLNIDNSFAVKISKKPFLVKIITACRLLNSAQINYIQSIQKNPIQITWADACKKIPCPDNSVELLYSCNMLEHLTKQKALSFLNEVKRVLVTGGVFRIAVPNLEYCVKRYLETKDADQFIGSLSCCIEDDTFVQRLNLAIFGARNHKWMYDKESLAGLLVKNGFQMPISLKPGETRIKDTQGLNLSEHAGYTLYMETIKT